MGHGRMIGQKKYGDKGDSPTCFDKGWKDLLSFILSKAIPLAWQLANNRITYNVCNFQSLKTFII